MSADNQIRPEYVHNMSQSFVPTKQPMIMSNVCYVSSVRTTLCDIMCTVNSSINFDVPPPPDKLRPLIATLPYKGIQNVKPLKPPTRFQNYQNAQNKRQLVDEMRRERDAFINKLLSEKKELEQRKNFAATKFQAIFRGHKVRPKYTCYVPKTKRKIIPTKNDMQDELCQMAADLGLKPIDGLSLETRGKTSRRRDRIMNAAAFRMHRFMSMIYQRSLARKRMEERRQEIFNISACILTRAVRYVKIAKFAKRCEVIRKNQMALKIQCRTRVFLAREK